MIFFATSLSFCSYSLPLSLSAASFKPRLENITSTPLPFVDLTETSLLMLNVKRLFSGTPKKISVFQINKLTSIFHASVLLLLMNCVKHC